MKKITFFILMFLSTAVIYAWIVIPAITAVFCVSCLSLAVYEGKRAPTYPANYGE